MWFFCGVRFFFVGLASCDTNLATSFTNIKNSKMRNLSMNSRNTSLNDLFSHGFFSCSAFFLLTNLVVLKPSIKQQSFREKVAAFGIYISEANRFGPNLVHQFGSKFSTLSSKKQWAHHPREKAPHSSTCGFKPHQKRQVSGQSLAPGMYETWLDRIIGDKLQAGSCWGLVQSSY